MLGQEFSPSNSYERNYPFPWNGCVHVLRVMLDIGDMFIREPYFCAGVVERIEAVDVRGSLRLQLNSAIGDPSACGGFEVNEREGVAWVGLSVPGSLIA